MYNLVGDIPVCCSHQTSHCSGLLSGAVINTMTKISVERKGIVSSHL